jgi:hypothetical protein
MRFQAVTSLLVLFTFSTNLWAQSLKRPLTLNHLKNDKELESDLFKNKKINKILERISDQEYQILIEEILKKSLSNFNKNQENCELGLISEIDSNTKISSLVISTQEALYLMRHLDLIDDIFLKINLINLNYLNSLKNSVEIKIPKVKVDSKLHELWNFSGLYSEFSSFPDEKSVCSIDALKTIVNKTKATAKELAKFNETALALKVINESTFQKLEVLRTLNLDEQTIDLDRYIDITMFAKNKLTRPLTPTDLAPTTYTQEHIYRFKNITRREALYKKFNSTEIMHLSEILILASKRMTAKNAKVEIEYDTQVPEFETYVLSPQEIYRMSLKLLRKDFVNANSSNLYSGKPITYNDIVMSSVETGAVSFEELSEVVMFEDFWNPKVPKWKTWVNFIFQFAGTASFLLPPPYNFISAIGLVFVQTKVNRIGNKEDADNNWNVIF